MQEELLHITCSKEKDAYFVCSEFIYEDLHEMYKN